MWIQNNLGGSGGMPPPENFEINGAFWGKKHFFGQNNVDSAAYSRIGSYAPAKQKHKPTQEPYAL